MVGFMFDTELTKQLDIVSTSFSSENPPPEVRSFIASYSGSSNTDNLLPYGLRGPIPNSLRILFYPAAMKLPTRLNLISWLIGRGQLSMMLKTWEPLQLRHSFMAQSGLICLGNPSLLSPIGSPLYHPLAGTAESTYASLLGCLIRSLKLIR
jgi:hypothetical protein